MNNANNENSPHQPEPPAVGVPSLAIGSAWIPVDKKMPADEITVLIAYSDGEVSIGHHAEGEWYDADAFASSLAGVTHWMHMPTSPISPNTRDDRRRATDSAQTNGA